MRRRGAGPQFTCFTSTKVQILTPAEQTRKVVCTILKDELSKFATSLESDEALLKSFGGAANSPKSLAMQLRIEKKLLLAKNIASLSR